MKINIYIIIWISVIFSSCKLGDTNYDGSFRLINKKPIDTIQYRINLLPEASVRLCDTSTSLNIRKARKIKYAIILEGDTLASIYPSQRNDLKKILVKNSKMKGISIEHISQNTNTVYNIEYQLYDNNPVVSATYFSCDLVWDINNQYFINNN